MDSFKQEPQAASSLHFLDYWRIIRIRKTVILAVFLLVVLTTTLVTFVLPEYYMSVVTMEVKKDSSTLEKLGGSSVVQGFDPYFQQTEFEKIQSKVVLYQVISNLNLGEVYRQSRKYEMNLKPEETLMLLKADMSVNQMRNTELIEVRVFNEDKAMAKRIANEIAEEYRKWRMESSSQRFTQGFTAITNQLDKYVQELNESEKEMNRRRNELGVTDDESTSREAQFFERQSITQFRNTYDMKQLEYDEKTKRLEGLQKIQDFEQLKVALPTSFPDTSLIVNFSDLFKNEAELERQLAGLLAQLGPNNLSVASARDELQKVKELLK